ncbi:hypothetical protein WN944_015377 [Citrus x changshan-huyou]|uniref:Rab-GAP TBC domain-containing protein n=1 Tax=Citrus x changshan-huyou TaxID=2935761 RepID=A0AAP0QLQ5_9ROSI|nr:uncharacterized protein LOC107176991 isoform X2 [Citrus sinensis]
MAVIVVWVCEVVKVWLLAVVASRMIGWITLLLTQEFNFANNLHIWDTLLSDPDGPQETLLRVCCAMLILIRRRLLAGDFTSNLKLLQNYPPISIRHLLCVANNDKLGLSLDLGSFIAGVMISTTNFAKHTLDQCWCPEHRTQAENKMVIGAGVGSMGSNNLEGKKGRKN